MYKEEFSIFKETYLKHFLATFFLFIFSSIIGYIVMVLNPQLAETALDSIIKTFEEKGIMEIEDPLLVTLALFKNNTLVALGSVISGFTAVIIVPYFVMASNGGMLGVLLGIMDVQGESPLHTLFAGILPHGVFEITAVVYAAGLGSYIAVSFIKLFIQHKGFVTVSILHQPFRLMLIQTGRSFLIVVVPLLAIAAVIEGYITPILLKL